MKEDNYVLPQFGFIKLETVLNIIPVSKSFWYTGVQQGIFPPPIKLGKRSAAYRVEDIRKLIEDLGSQK